MQSPVIIGNHIKNIICSNLLKANGFKYVLTDKHVLKDLAQSEV